MRRDDVFIFIYTPKETHALPNKYVRTLNNKALIQYSYDLAVKIALKQHICTVTDNEEIQLLSIRNNINCLLFTKEEDCSFFNQEKIISHMRAVEKQRGSKHDTVIWLSPNSPLLRSTTLNDAIEALKKSTKSSLFSALEQEKKEWKYTNTYHPHFITEPNTLGYTLHKETSSFFLMKRQTITLKGYQGKKGAPYILPLSQGLEINSFHEWWIAEKLLNRKRIVITVIGNSEVGMGHIYRTLFLARNLHEHELIFICLFDNGLAFKSISKENYQVFVQKKTESLYECVVKQAPDLVINDILNTERSYMEQLKKSGIKTINFEDDSSAAKNANCVINALFSEKKYKHMVVGHPYFCLRSEFLSAKQGRFKKHVKRILITFGGTDHSNLTLKLVKLLSKIDCGKIKISIVTGPGYKDQELLEQFLIQDKHNTYEWVKFGTKKMSEMMRMSDIAITSAGRTVFELAHLTVPSIVIASNKKELQHGFAIKAGMIYLGLHSSLSDDTISSAIKSLLSNSKKRQNIHENLKQFNFKNNDKNVLRLIKDQL